MRLLSAFGDGPPIMTLAQLSEAAGLARSTALRYARQLTAAGFLERLDDGRYVIGLRMLEIASLAPRGHGLREVALPFMQDLHQGTGQHVLLAVREDLEAVLVERLSAHRPSAVSYRVGGRLPLATTGVGLVLAAHAPVVDQQRLLEQSPDPEHLRRVLDQVRTAGVAVGTGHDPRPVRTVAAPLLDGSRSVVAALSVVGPPDALADVTGLTRTVQGVARALSRRLAFH